MKERTNTNFDTVMNELQKAIKDWFDTNMIAYEATDYLDSVSWLVAFVELQRRLITPVRRNIKISNGLQSKISKGIFDSSIINGLSHIERNIKEGIDINNHLTRQVFDMQRKDLLRNDWGIKHIHLSNKEAITRADMANNRSSYYLLAVFTPDTAFFLDIVPHLKGEEFADQAYQQILVDNGWAEYAGLYDIGEGELTQSYTRDQLYTLRKNGINAGMLEYNGHIYIPLGITLDGSNSTDVEISVSFCRKLKQNLSSLAGFTITDIRLAIPEFLVKIDLLLEDGKSVSSVIYGKDYIPPQILR